MRIAHLQFKIHEITGASKHYGRKGIADVIFKPIQISQPMLTVSPL